MVVRFDIGKVCLWEIKVTPQYLVLSCCDVNKERGGTTDVLFGDEYGKFGCMCF